MQPGPVNVDAPSVRRSHLKRFLMVWCLVFAACYVLTYVGLSRAGMREWKAMGIQVPGFWYLPVSMLGGGGREAWIAERLLSSFFSPVNFIDRELFGGPSPAGEPLWGIRNK